MEPTYPSQKKKEYTVKLRAILRELPPFCSDYFRACDASTSVLTRYGYAVDQRSFFQYLVTLDDLFPEKALPSLDMADLRKVKPCHIEMFLQEMSLYEKNDRELANQDRAKSRKLSAIRALFHYLFQNELLPSNVAELVATPKIHEKAIIRMEPNEVADMLDLAESGDKLTAQQKRFHQQTGMRDSAILTLFLGTGIRISELVGIDIPDVDFENGEFAVTRKGGARAILSFGDEVSDALKPYYEWRLLQTAAEGHEKALFLSLQKKRITPRTVENLVKKYASAAAPLKKITPHKLRSTFGTMLYHETQDIYLVADVLGHKDVNTTRKHYAATSEENKRIAARTIRLRD